MHIPDGFLSPTVAVSACALSAMGLSFTYKKCQRDFAETMIPMMGVMSAFIFTAQMVNFPIAMGTSGHLLGGMLAAALLGPAAGTLIIALILAVQCLLFQDGGLLALGANIFNMGLIGTYGVYFIYRGLYVVLQKINPRLLSGALFISAWLSVVLSSTFCAFELALSEVVPLKSALVAMVSVHAVIGVVEATITTLLVSFVLKVRPDLNRGMDWRVEESYAKINS